ncbi:cGMP-specific 3',5'-cyclic phosphodiesterase isoform X2 [Condylostylus longicornis]|uniref:cGMP-specific 3',5'-cyclic phosphodiesterase isoform X2 n=1 Tax=Condylostylus longicornis TaxID=2530218 RepID=UPI00244E427B|nr:cGMP-specific 3',5'-cyclic phosphodiesterase isoform X2 [Condylostylus longicornis]
MEETELKLKDEKILDSNELVNNNTFNNNNIVPSMDCDTIIEKIPTIDVSDEQCSSLIKATMDKTTIIPKELLIKNETTNNIKMITDNTIKTTTTTTTTNINSPLTDDEMTTNTITTATTTTTNNTDNTMVSVKINEASPPLQLTSSISPITNEIEITENKSIISSNQIVTTLPSSTTTTTEENLINHENLIQTNNNNDKMNTIAIVTSKDVDDIARLFEEKPEAFEKWLTERAQPDVVSKLHKFIESRSLLLPQKSPKRTSVSSELFQQWMASSPVQNCRQNPISRRNIIESRRQLQDLDQGELFMELIRDVANELDIDVLCHKILVNVGLLTHADRGSLFLAKGSPTNRYLVAKLFDVTQSTALSEAVKKARTEEIIIPFGVGIAGTVAETKEMINIKEAYKDARFNCEIDLKTGYKTHAILCMPICNYEGDVIGVAQIINKTNGSTEFNDHDVEIFRRYLTFCGIGIQNAQLFEMSVQEYRRNQILLNLARSIFEEQNNLECLVTKIMTEARELLKCERCAVFLVDLDCCEASHLEKIIEKPSNQGALTRRPSKNVKVEEIIENQKKTRARFTVLFELGRENQAANVSRPSVDDLNNSTLAQIAQCVASTGQTLNIADVREWVREHNQIQSDCEIDSTKAILCMPIVNAKKIVVGVAQLINKGNGLPFTDSDVSIFEAFAIFCGLGIHNTQMYENACKLMAKQKVALECLSYHATATPEQTSKLVSDTIRSAEVYNLYSFKFIDFDLNEDDTCRAAIRMFLQCNLVQQFHIPYDVLCRWVLSVRKNYRPVKYHNWRHALNVAQTMFAMMKTGKMERFMTDLEILGLLVACFCHDLDHRGTNNAFQTKTESPLAILYTTSTMEHHHFDQCVMILNSEGNNIFQALSPEDYKRVMNVVEKAILSTDLAMYFKKRNAFLELVENGEFDWQSQEKKELLCGMMMTACDVSAIAKPWEVQHRVAKMVADEFFDQGDLEKLQLNTQPVAMMDRERKDELPKMQVGFIDLICLPLYRVLCDTFPWMKPLYEGTLENRSNWQDLAEKVEMGLTWIDDDTIDRPVEEFSACKEEEIKDIEFTSVTLNCQHSQDGDPPTPEHHRSRFSSIKKTTALGKAVRSKLSKSLHSTSMQESYTTTNNSNTGIVGGAGNSSSTSSTITAGNKRVLKTPDNETKSFECDEIIGSGGGVGGISGGGTQQSAATTTSSGKNSSSEPKSEKVKKKSKFFSLL